MESRLSRTEVLVSVSIERIQRLENDVRELRILLQLENKVLEHENTMDDHETRIREMERANIRLAAYVGLVATVGSMAAQLFIRKVLGG